MYVYSSMHVFLGKEDYSWKLNPDKEEEERIKWWSEEEEEHDEQCPEKISYFFLNFTKQFYNILGCTKSQIVLS